MHTTVTIGKPVVLGEDWRLRSTWVTSLLQECMSIWVYEYMSMSIWIYEIWVYEYMSIWVYECMSIWVYEYMSIWVWVYEYMSIWVYECMRIYIHIYIYIYIYIYTCRLAFLPYQSLWLALVQSLLTMALKWSSLCSPLTLIPMMWYRLLIVHFRKVHIHIHIRIHTYIHACILTSWLVWLFRICVSPM